MNAGHILGSSLGYILPPLGHVAVSYLILHERLRPLQWTAIACAAAGVAGLLLGVGHVPWIALALAETWCGLVLYTADNLRSQRPVPRHAPAA